MTIPLKILMLEDTAGDAEIVQQLLKKEELSFEFSLVMNKDAFLIALDEFQPDIILADNSLPQFNATDVLKIIQKRSEHIPCILVTGTASEEFAAGIIKSGAEDYILKDRLGRLPAAIHSAIKHQRAEKQRKDALEKLRRSEENHRALIERVSDAFVALDANWRFQYVNKKAGQILKRNPDELLNKHLWTEFGDSLGKQFYKSYHEATEQPGDTHFEEYSDVFDRWFENHIYSSPSGISIYLRDITERKKAEQELKTVYDRLFFLVENSPLGFIEWDNQTHVKSWSKRAEQIFGYTEEEIISLQKSGLSQVYEEDLDVMAKVAEQLANGELERFSVQHRNYTKSRAVIWCEWFNSVLRDSNGKVTTILSLVQDITERKKVEWNLIQSEKRLNEAQAIAQMGNWEIDLTRNIQTWSDGLYRLYGLEKNEVIPSTELFVSLMHPYDIDYGITKVQEAFDSLKNSSFHFRFTKRDGRIGHGYSEWEFEFDKNGKPLRLYGIVQDITERKKGEEELRQINEELRDLSSHLQNIREEERLQIARDIHDDLGQQLTGLKMGVSWLNKKLKTEDETVKQKMHDLIELLDETVKSVRRISSSLRPSILDDLGLIAALEWHSEEVEKRSEVKVNFTADRLNPEISGAMATAIFRIYQEVLTNALRHANAHIVTSSLRLEDNWIILKINDDGKGMDSDTIGTKKTLGLIGIKERTFALGGKYDFKSEPGKGTEVQISIPFGK